MWLLNVLPGVFSFFGTKLGKGAIVLLLALGAYFLVQHELQLRVDLKTAIKEAAEWKKKLEDVNLGIKEADDKKAAVDSVIATVDENNIDLLCLARYGKSPVGPTEYITPEPTIIEVIKYRDKPVITTPPMITPVHVNDPAVSDTIGTSVLNNSWKAYCAVTDNRDDVCIPFR